MKIPSLDEVLVPFNNPRELEVAVMAKERFSFVKYAPPKATEGETRTLRNGTKQVDFIIEHVPVKVEGVIATRYEYKKDLEVVDFTVIGKSLFPNYSEQWRLRYDFKTNKWTIKDVYQ